MSSFSIKIKCGSCNKNKSKELFSKTAIAKHQESQRQHARNSKVPVKSINCLACNTGNREELQCSMCSRTMALEKFNKTQRRKNDDALCLDCSQEKTDREADYEKERQEIAIIDDIRKEEISALNFHAHSSRVSSAQRSRLEFANSRFETETNPSSNDWALGNDAVSLVGSGSSGHSSNDTRPTTGTDWDTYAGIKHSTTTSGLGSKAGFVKQNAVPKSPREKARAQYERELRRTQEQEEVVRDESDESDEEECPY